MKFIPDSNQQFSLFGKEVSSLKYTLIIFGYIFFLGFIWPIISRSYLFIPGAIAFGAIFPGEWLNDEFGLSNKTALSFIAYLLVVIFTLIYTSFFLDTHWALNILHFPVIGLFPYMFLKQYR